MLLSAKVSLFLVLAKSSSDEWNIVFESAYFWHWLCLCNVLYYSFWLSNGAHIRIKQTDCLNVLSAEFCPVLKVLCKEIFLLVCRCSLLKSSAIWFPASLLAPLIQNGSPETPSRYSVRNVCERSCMYMRPCECLFPLKAYVLILFRKTMKWYCLRPLSHLLTLDILLYSHSF